MKNLLSTVCCLLLGVSLLAGCGGGGSAIPPLVRSSPSTHPTQTPTSAPLTVVNPPPAPPVFNVGQYNGFGLINWVQGGVGQVTVNIKSGTLPAGLMLDGTGQLTGIPTTVSTSTVVVTFTDSGNPPSSVNVSIFITINPPLPLAIGPLSGALPGGTVGAPYNPVCHAFGYGILCHYGFRISATGGVVPYVFSGVALPGSSLPPGLNIDSGGVISGTPTMAGTYKFRVTVTDSESPPKQASANYTITVAPAPSPSPSSSP